MSFRRSYHPGLNALKNGRKTIQTLFYTVQRMLEESYGYDFSDTENFPNGFIDMLGHTDAYADWVADQKGKMDDVDYELLVTIRNILDYS